MQPPTHPPPPHAEQRLRAIRFDGPAYVPVNFQINKACAHDPDVRRLETLIRSHPLLFPDPERRITDLHSEPAPWQREGEPYRDPWGCLWQTTEHGITGCVVEHPLEDWANWPSWTPPNPERFNGWGPFDWDATAASRNTQLERGELRDGALRHGFLFLTLTYLRGFENAIFDMHDAEPRLDELLHAIERFDAEMVRRHLDTQIDVLRYPEDLGAQQSPMISPELFRKYLKPIYARLMRPAVQRGIVVHMHSDGYVMDLVDDLIECGVNVLNIQDVVNGIDRIAEQLRGRVAIDLDLDRRGIVHTGTPDDVDRHVREVIHKLATPNGGLLLMYDLYPGVPMDNVAALMDALETHTGIGG